MSDVELGADGSPSDAKRASAWAWGICWLMFASTVLNYMDRQTVALVGDQIKSEFRLDDAGFGWVLAAFYLSYALFQVPAGFVVDRLNVRWSYAGAVGWWSLAAMAASFSPTLGILMIFRAFLGVGESFNWPCALKATAIVLPPRDRSLGNGIFNSGAAVGAVVTPLIVPPLAQAFGWRTAFLVVGGLGFVWVIAWLSVLGGERRNWLAGHARKPVLNDDLLESRPSLSPIAKAAFGAVLVAACLMAAQSYRVGLPALWWAISILMVGTLLAALAVPMRHLKGSDWTESLGEVVRQRRFWVLVVVSIAINVTWHFLVNWLPTYLKSDRGMTYLASGMLSAVPFLAADVGNLGGGALSRWFAKLGFSPPTARMIVIALCTLIITSGAWVGWVKSDTIVIILLGAMAMGTAAFMANYFAFAQEVSSRHTGLIVGILGGLGNLAAAGFLPFAGYVKVVTKSFAPIFVLVGVLPFVGMIALLVGWRKARQDANLT